MAIFVISHVKLQIIAEISRKIKDYDISVLSSRIRIQISHKSYVIVTQLWTTRPGVCSLTLIFCLNYHHYFLDVSSLRKEEHTDLYTPHPSAK